VPCSPLPGTADPGGEVAAGHLSPEDGQLMAKDENLDVVLPAVRRTCRKDDQTAQEQVDEAKSMDESPSDRRPDPTNVLAIRMIDGFRALQAPSLGKKHCPTCGQATITTCPNCDAEILGEYIVPGVIGAGSGYSPPAYCHECGSRYPWTERALEAARELTSEDDELSDADKELLASSLDESRTRLGLNWRRVASSA
jgi:hypothetical protein